MKCIDNKLLILGYLLFYKDIIKNNCIFISRINIKCIFKNIKDLNTF